MSKIKSKSDLFPGMVIEKPKMATFIYDAQGVHLYRCPYCKNVADSDECDVCGAEPDCLFCNQCNREFEMPI